MIDVITLQLCNVPNYVLYVLLLFNVLFVVVAMVRRVDGVFNTKRIMMSMLLLDYLSFMLCSTIFFRNYRPNEIRIELMPFWNYEEVFSGEFNVQFWEAILNVLLYIPIGFLLKYILYKRSIGQILIISIAISVFTEMMQLVLHRGMCETDDLIHNTIGSLIGISLCGMINKFLKSFRK